ncbi:MAG: CapA family protein [Coriobacteriales bacterium]|nr:CapA family protein [Coriobacteriales bacterium]
MPRSRSSGSTRAPRAPRFLVAAIVLLLAALTTISYLGACTSVFSASSSTRFDAAELSDRLAPGIDPATGAPAEPARVTFAAVGDNLIHGAVYNAAATGDGGYDFTGFYAPCKPYIEDVDIAYINQETICAGTEFGLSSYPMFNSPTQVLDAVAATGFDWISTASNHAMDKFDAGVFAQLAHIRSLPLIATGTHDSAEDAATPKTIERNGVVFGLASYTYGLNGMELPADEPWLVDLIDADKIAADVARLKEVSDVQIVSMHAGSEYVYQPNDEQLWLGQYLADLGVDVVVGTHPHVINPTTMLTGKDGNRTLCIYSLGNFLSAQDDPPRMLGEMARWTISYDRFTNTVGIEDVELWPTVTHITPGFKSFGCYALKDYSADLAATHELAGVGLSREQLCALASEVLGSEFSVVM